MKYQRTKIKGSFWIVLFFLLLGLFGIIQSLTFNYWESMVLPLAISSLIFILASIEICKELFHRNSREEASVKKNIKETENHFSISRFGLVFGWAAGFCLAVYLLGFHLAIPLFSFTYLKWRGRSWLIAIIFAIAISVFIYAIFDLGLKSPLYKGLILGSF